MKKLKAFNTIKDSNDEGYQNSKVYISDEINNDQYIQFPCIRHDKLTNVNECISCHDCLTCDIYSTMLDEDADTH